MVRTDEGLPFLLRYENIAHYDDGIVWILDRRTYPAREDFVRCADYRQVANAIADMVTQSGGPLFAASLGMVSAARQAKGLSLPEARKILQQSADELSQARPTTSANMQSHIQKVLKIALAAVEQGEDAEAKAHTYVMENIEKRYQLSRIMADYMVDLLPDKAAILTQCYAETLIGFILLACRERGKDISLICPETRPYLQGARLTASVACDMGVPVTVITDNMPAYVLSKKMVQVFISAADVATLDGHIVNKIGTFQIALAAHYFGIPFYAIASPSRKHPDISTVVIEERSPEETLQVMGIRTAKEGVKGYYPAFDITPPHLVSAVVTHRGVFSPWDLKRYFEE